MPQSIAVPSDYKEKPWVKMLSAQLYERRLRPIYEVDAPENVYLVEAESIEYRYSAQQVDRELLKRSVRPAPFDEELISSIGPDAALVRLGIYRLGYFSTTDLPEKDILVNLLPRSIQHNVGN